MPIPFVKNNLYWQPVPDSTPLEPESEKPQPFMPEHVPQPDLPKLRWAGIPNAEREWMENTLGVPAIDDVKLEPTVLQLSTNGTRLRAGQGVHLGNTFFNLLGGNVYIQDYAFFGQYCQVLTGSHDYRRTNRQRHPLEPRHGNDIVIEEGVWIASGTIIVGPCRIGAHAVIGAGSVVLPGDYAGGCIYAGNPAVFKKRIDFTTD
jgi:acetyltransferase-like isoleucine patch superfamily enzyme